MAKFQLGDRVTKTKGSKWTGRVVGTYATDLTAEGYAVESETEKGSVQIYPAAALKHASSAVTAPAASGGGPVDGCEDCAYNGRYLCDTHGPPPAAASVSERARDDLHVAICQAVALMNMEPMTTPGLLQAHDILRKAIS